MDVILHIGAHRTASTTLQHYLRANLHALRDQGIGFVGPRRTRDDGLLSGIQPDGAGAAQPDQARRRIARRCGRAAKSGLRHLVISDENMLGSVRRNLRQRMFYRDAGARLARYADAFDGRVARVVLSLRGLDAYWTSALAFGVGRGRPLPTPGDLDRLAQTRRSWRNLVEETAAAFPDAEIQLHSHEDLAGRPERRLWHMVGGGIEPPMNAARLWLNRAPDLPELRRLLAARGENAETLPSGTGRWAPFDAAQLAALRETHADDMFWLRAGADGTAKLIEEANPDQGGTNLPDGTKTRGQKDDGQDGRMARAG
ncbi:hypothetical protein [Marimonas lutisalis]|uniref:hypothetical protein n=1 Tax=Marimonas lutisalis TaxID=2545756 RepID=UPI0010F6304C|nr:hypothetical protein [Marimonas lutisalis]